MRVGVDIRSLLDRHLTGVGEYTQQLLEALLFDGHDDTYVLFSNTFRGSPSVPSHWLTGRAELRTFPFPNKLFNLSLLALHWPKLDRLCGQIDCFFAPNLQFCPLTDDMPFVLTVHDLSFVHYRELLSLHRRFWHTLVRPRELCARADAICAVSNATAVDCARTFSLPQEKIHPIHSGCTTLLVSDELRARVRSAWRLPAHFLLLLSTIEPRKNLLAALDAFTLLRQRSDYDGGLVIAGAPGWSRGALKTALERHPYRDAIQVLPYVTTEEKHALFSLADVFLYLSVYEGFGFPPLEAAAQGTPVVAGHHSSLTELLDGSALL
ncbi:MAG: glycosyltransferase family 1 protein, partial [bacterium]